MKIFIGASSNKNMPKKYVDDCERLINDLLKDNDLVFGARDEGLMGLSYHAAKNNKRKVTGICPEFYIDSLNDLDCDNVEITTSIMDSTLKIYKNSDAIVMLPGGYGSIYEFFTANYCKICNEIDIPIILYNSCGYFDKLISFIDDVCKQGLVRESEMGHFFVANTKEEVMNYLNNRM